MEPRRLARCSLWVARQKWSFNFFRIVLLKWGNFGANLKKFPKNHYKRSHLVSLRSMVLKLDKVIDLGEMYLVFHFCLFKVKHEEMAAIWKWKIDLSIFSQTLIFFDGIFFSCDAHQLDKTFAIKKIFIRCKLWPKIDFFVFGVKKVKMWFAITIFL